MRQHRLETLDNEKPWIMNPAGGCNQVMGVARAWEPRGGGDWWKGVAALSTMAGISLSIPYGWEGGCMSHKMQTQ